MFKAHRLAAIGGVFILLLAACGPAATPTPTTGPQPTPAMAGATATPVGPAPTATKPAPSPTPAASPTPAIRTGGKLRVNTGPIVSLDPHAIAARGATQASHIMDTLVRQDPKTGRIGPWLAESWDSPDPTTLVFKLKRGVLFHDGSPFNAQVAKWNFDRILNPETVSPTARPGISSVARVEVVDDSTVRVELKRPASDLFYFLSMGQLAMMTPTAVAKWGKDVGAHPVGTGAFIFQDWIPDQRFWVTRNPNYWGAPLPYLGEIVWSISDDPSVIMASLVTGLIDAAPITVPEHVDRLEKTAGISIHPLPGQITFGLLFNHLNPTMSNPDFRKALDLGVDREAILKALLKGRGSPATTILSPAFPEYNTTLPVVKRDVTRAKELLARSGYKGQVLDMGLSPGNAVAPKLAEVLQAQWKEIGVNIQLTIHPTAAYGKVLGQLLYDISLLWAAHIPLENRLNIYYASQGRLNMGRYGDTPWARKIDELVDQIGAAYDWNTRKHLFDELQQVVYDNVADLYVVAGDQAWATRERVQNFTPVPGAAAEDWREVWVKD